MKTVFNEGTKMRVIKLNHEHKAAKRLIDMGITPGSVLSIQQIAPLGDPFIIRIRDYSLAVRKKDLLAAELKTLD